MRGSQPGSLVRIVAMRRDRIVAVIGGVTDDRTGGERRVWASTGVPGPGLRLSCPRRPFRLRPSRMKSPRRGETPVMTAADAFQALATFMEEVGVIMVFSIWKDEERNFNSV